MKRENLTRFAWLSIFAAILTIGLKTGAYWLTGSVGLLSDALESLINLAAAVTALLLLKLASRPPDDEHAFGHDKAEYFASGIEGTLILLAAAGIGWTAVSRLFAPRPLEQVGVALIISGAATLINLIVGQVLIRAGRRHRSITLEADGRHLMTDVWTTIGVILGVWAVGVTGWLFLDPLVALLVAANIIWAGIRLMRRSALGLMDTSISAKNQESIRTVLDFYVKERGIDYHALRTRQAAARAFVSVHILVPGDWTVHQGHQLLEEIEADIRSNVPGAIVFTHLESLDDPASWEDIELDRTGN
ncbi:MAG: cation diffusion facilitator family transporter [Pyrinomonadaceae bacterium]|nr:cation transporter [Blastocatellia bacterium]MDQ3220427.1 cation diffusion facilitator family transporter [Acidobacteriota bacterium]MDQ3490438.1 cation diffusion facilitator family transporter [Acidobacteriota bacterium]